MFVNGPSCCWSPMATMRVIWGSVAMMTHTLASGIVPASSSTASDRRSARQLASASSRSSLLSRFATALLQEPMVVKTARQARRLFLCSSSFTSFKVSSTS